MGPMGIAGGLTVIAMGFNNEVGSLVEVIMVGGSAGGLACGLGEQLARNTPNTSKAVNIFTVHLFMGLTYHRRSTG